MRKGGGWVYIMTNRPNGTLYLGVTSDIARRAWQHREGLVEGFTKRYGLSQLVYAERHDEIVAAIQRERTMKHWPRAWKVNLIVAQNPDWPPPLRLLTRKYQSNISTAHSSCKETETLNQRFHISRMISQEFAITTKLHVPKS